MMTTGADHARDHAARAADRTPSEAEADERLRQRFHAAFFWPFKACWRPLESCGICLESLGFAAAFIFHQTARKTVLRMIKDVVRAGRRREVPVSICGEVAGETLYTMLLMGLGLRSLSVTPSRIPYLKRVVRSVDIGSCERLARTACSFDSERQVTAYLRDQARKIIPDVAGGRSAESDWF